MREARRRLYNVQLQAVHKYVEHKKPNFINVDEDRLKQLLMTASESKKRASGEPEDETLQKGSSLNPCSCVCSYGVCPCSGGVP